MKENLGWLGYIGDEKLPIKNSDYNKPLRISIKQRVMDVNREL